MDLSPLSIDRSQAKRRRRGGFPWGRLLLLGILAATLFLFRSPLLRKLDSLRLLRVETAVVYRPDARAAAASTGTAANGYVIARTRAALSADTPGRIVELNVEEGSVVKAGDVVARLYSEELEAAVRAAQAEVAAAEARAAGATTQVQVARAALPDLQAQVNLASSRLAAGQASIKSAQAVATLAVQERERAEALLQQNAGSRQAVDRARSEESRSAAEQQRTEHELGTLHAAVSAAEATLLRAKVAITAAEASVTESRAQIPVQLALLEQTQATLAKTVVRAPFDGVVVLKDAEIGEVVSPNAQGSSSRGSVATMVDFSTLEVQVELPETSIGAVILDGPVQVFLDAYPTRSYAGRVDRIWPTANRQKGTIEVRITLSDPDSDLRPEMGARVSFAEAAPDSDKPSGPAHLRIPASALVETDGAAHVFLVERGRVSLQAIEPGVRRGTLLEVLSGLAEGQIVVLNPPPSLAEGDSVQVRPN
ncbi:MAG: HlyD family secretion protein [Planctomycetota bacterium]|jgi:HlyD family secretion protein